jgi:hypothetical protein
MHKYVLAAVLALAACSGSTPTTPVDAVGPDAPANQPFGALCNTATDSGSTECMSGVCTSTIDMLMHDVCSQTCTVLGGTDPTCPTGSMGQKCNMKGYCRP